LLIHQLSHDFQSPLGRIIGLVDITQLENDLAKRDELIQLISQQTKSLSSYVREVVEYSKSVREKPMLEKINLNTIINEVLTAVKPVENEDIDYRLQMPEPLIINSDKIALTAIISNLLSNSVRYRDKTKTNKFIAINCKIIDQKLILSVEDNGIGIEPEHQNRIFEIFYRVPSSLKGSGLGLYIVKESVKKLNGKITLISQLGVGSQFVVELPF